MSENTQSTTEYFVVSNITPKKYLRGADKDWREFYFIRLQNGKIFDALQAKPGEIMHRHVEQAFLNRKDDLASAFVKGINEGKKLINEKSFSTEYQPRFALQHLLLRYHELFDSKDDNDSCIGGLTLPEFIAKKNKHSHNQINMTSITEEQWTECRKAYSDIIKELDDRIEKKKIKDKENEEKIQSSKMKILRTIAKDNVSPEKGVVHPKRSAEEKHNIKLVLDSISKGIND